MSEPILSREEWEAVMLDHRLPWGDGARDAYVLLVADREALRVALSEAREALGELIEWLGKDDFDAVAMLDVVMRARRLVEQEETP